MLGLTKPATLELDMITITHMCAGYLIAEGLGSLGLIPRDKQFQMTMVSILAANLPDMDAVVRLKIANHRSGTPGHYPLFWLMLITIGFSLIKISHLPQLTPFLGVTFIGIFSHFIMDSLDITTGIQWLAPFVRKEYSFFEVHPSGASNLKEMILFYRNKKIFYAEVSVWIFTLIVWRMITKM